MHPLYDEAMSVVTDLGDERIRIAHLAKELAETEYELQLRQAKIERDLIKRVGSERKLGPTVDDRARIFTVAVDADEAYQALRKKRTQLELELAEAKAQETSLRDKLRVMLAAMRGPGEVTEA
jgi:hypothetical protein